MALVALMLFLGAMFSARRSKLPPPELPVLGQVPVFSMRNQRGHTVTNTSLQGGVSIVDFFFTSCPVACPRLTGRMAELGAELVRRRAPVRLVSISVDPETDTPAKLSEYARRYHVDDERWWFLSGEAEALSRVVVDGFKVHFSKADPATGIYEIMHGNWFLLVDSRGQIRGYYLSDEPNRLRDLIDDAVLLASESH